MIATAPRCLLQRKLERDDIDRASRKN